MKKTISIIIILTIAVYGVFKLVTFELFDDNFTLIEEIQIKDKDYKLKIIFFPSNATIQSSIQVRTVENDVEEVIGDYERYNFLESYEIKNDSLFIVLNDTMRAHVKVKKIKIKLP